MKILFSTKHTNGTVNLGLLFFRVALCTLMIPHGYDKLVHFSTYSKHFVNLLHIGSTATLCLSIFAEFFCSIFLIMGLFSRLATILLILNMCGAVFLVHHTDIFGKGEHAALFLVGYLTLLVLGPGKISMDNLIGK